MGVNVQQGTILSALSDKPDQTDLAVKDINAQVFISSLDMSSSDQDAKGICFIVGMSSSSVSSSSSDSSVSAYNSLHKWHQSSVYPVLTTTMTSPRAGLVDFSRDTSFSSSSSSVSSSSCDSSVYIYISLYILNGINVLCVQY